MLRDGGEINAVFLGYPIQEGSMPHLYNPVPRFHVGSPKIMFRALK